MYRSIRFDRAQRFVAAGFLISTFGCNLFSGNHAQKRSASTVSGGATNFFFWGSVLQGDGSCAPGRYSAVQDVTFGQPVENQPNTCGNGADIHAQMVDNDGAPIGPAGSFQPQAFLALMANGSKVYQTNADTSCTSPDAYACWSANVQPDGSVTFPNVVIDQADTGGGYTLRLVYYNFDDTAQIAADETAAFNMGTGPVSQGTAVWAASNPDSWNGWTAHTNFYPSGSCLDSEGNGIAGASVNFDIEPPGSGTCPSAQTDDSGNFTAFCSTSGVSGSWTVSFRCTDGSGATSPASDTRGGSTLPGTADTITKTGGDGQTGTVTQALQPLTVALTDGDGNPAAGSVAWTDGSGNPIDCDPNTDGTQNTTTAGADGATGCTPSLGCAAGTQKFFATLGTTSVEFDETALVGAPDHFVFVSVPVGNTADDTLAAAAQVVDSCGNATDDGGAASGAQLSLIDGATSAPRDFTPPGAVAAASDVGGLVTWSFVIQKAATGYAVTAAFNGNTATSGLFDIGPGVPCSLSAVAGLPTQDVVGSIEPNLAAIASDAYGNTEGSGREVDWATAGAGTVSPVSTLTDASGTASTLEVRLDPKAGPNVFVATIPNRSSICPAGNDGSAAFTINGVAGAAFHLTRVNGRQYVAGPGTAFRCEIDGADCDGSGFEVILTDVEANPVAGANVNWGCGSMANCTGSSSTTDANGIASMTATAGYTTGDALITASFGSPALFSTDVQGQILAGLPDHFGPFTIPDAALVGENFSVDVPIFTDTGDPSAVSDNIFLNVVYDGDPSEPAGDLCSPSNIAFFSQFASVGNSGTPGVAHFDGLRFFVAPVNSRCHLLAVDESNPTVANELSSNTVTPIPPATFTAFSIPDPIVVGDDIFSVDVDMIAPDGSPSTLTDGAIVTVNYDVVNCPDASLQSSFVLPDASGHFHFDGLQFTSGSPGDHCTLSVNSNNFQVPTQTSTNAATLVSPGQFGSFTIPNPIKLGASFSVTVTVLDNNGDPSPATDPVHLAPVIDFQNCPFGVTLSANSVIPSGGVAQFDNLSFTGPVGTCRLQAVSDHLGWPKLSSDNAATILPGDFATGQLLPGSNTAFNFVVNGNAGYVGSTVGVAVLSTDVSGNPVGGIHATFSIDGTTIGGGVTDASGLLALPDSVNLPTTAGPHAVVATLSDGGVSANVTGTLWGIATAPVSLTTTGDGTTIDSDDAPALLTAVLSDQYGNPVFTDLQSDALLFNFYGMTNTVGCTSADAQFPNGVAQCFLFPGSDPVSPVVGLSYFWSNNQSAVFDLGPTFTHFDYGPHLGVFMKAEASPTTNDLNAVLCGDGNDARDFAVGSGGTVLIDDGTGWVQAAVGTAYAGYNFRRVIKTFFNPPTYLLIGDDGAGHAIALSGSDFTNLTDVTPGIDPIAGYTVGGSFKAGYYDGGGNVGIYGDNGSGGPLGYFGPVGSMQPDPLPPATINGTSVSTAINAASSVSTILGSGVVLGNGGYVAVGGGLQWTAMPLSFFGTFDTTDFIGFEPQPPSGLTLYGRASSQGSESFVFQNSDPANPFIDESGIPFNRTGGINNTFVSGNDQSILKTAGGFAADDGVWVHRHGPGGTLLRNSGKFNDVCQRQGVQPEGGPVLAVGASGAIVSQTDVGKKPIVGWPPPAPTTDWVCQAGTFGAQGEFNCECAHWGVDGPWGIYLDGTIVTDNGVDQCDLTGSY